MENDKFQELMMNQFAKLFNEIQTFKKDMSTNLAGVKSELSSVKSELTSVKSELTSVKESQVRMESEFGRKLDALYHDLRESQKQFNSAISTEIRNLATKVEELQIVSNIHDAVYEG
ncbi:hypothetical protein [Desulfosporosinus metallidurans]|uniref:Chromosome partition protein smc n=1 Tax=Desulfosporosinus metallidurans TaxID=1888891 RepID=A0A1Q8QFY5_9FIRM|nr:hypothetical protein [Desulfosporosinus metallidurans]OLN26250.1 Chromosome partition protein smc [Desulfosporosinus metallidurans]